MKCLATGWPAVLLLITAWSQGLHAQELIQSIPGPNGITYQDWKIKVNRPITTTEWKDQEQTVYKPQVKQETQQVFQPYNRPVTEYKWLSRMHGRWNPFATPHYTHHLVPVTRWETTTAELKIPTTRTEWVAEKQTVKVPVTTTKIVQEEVVQRYAVATPALQPAIQPMVQPITPVYATPRIVYAPQPLYVPYQYGGVALPSDPPRTATGWHPTGSTVSQ